MSTEPAAPLEVPASPDASFPDSTVMPATADVIKTAPGDVEKEKSKKPKASRRPMNVYDWMLIFSFLFILIATAALLYELSTYGFEIRPGFRLF